MQMGRRSRKRLKGKSSLTKGREAVDWPQQWVEFEDLYREVAYVEHLLKRESDRGCALIGGAGLEEALGGVLRAFFVNDKKLCHELLVDFGAPLFGFASRLRACRAIGLLTDDLYHDIDVVRDIRNKAAHFDSRKGNHFRFSFKRQDIAEKCRSLRSNPQRESKELSARQLFEAFVGTATAVLSVIPQCCAPKLSLEKNDGAGHSVYRELVYYATERLTLPVLRKYIRWAMEDHEVIARPSRPKRQTVPKTANHRRRGRAGRRF